MYSVKKISNLLAKKLNQYLEADYHIWDESLIQARRKLIYRKNVTSSDPRLEASPEYLTGVEFSEMNIPKDASLLLTSLSKIKNSGVFPVPRLHQQKALEKFLGQQTEIVVSTGTGSGKTESFLYPILGSFALEKDRGPEVVSKSGCRVLLLYPMNALVNDQLSRLRRMLGNERVSEEISKFRGRKPTFAVYTSKTDYPGKRSKTRDQNLKNKIQSLFLGDALKYKKNLFDEGLWPAKDMESFLANNLKQSASDAELYSRHEVQDKTPDILITNYSMLEYMLARPIERQIFESTSDWLKSHDDNYLTIVLDEAHMYKGVSGAEVALLLRRLHSRLGVDRSKIRYILTSASFGSNNENDAITFAKNLTGKPDGAKAFDLILGEKKSKQGEGLPSLEQLIALSTFDISTIHNTSSSLDPAKEQIEKLFSQLKLGHPSSEIKSEEDLKNYVYEKLEIFPPAAYLANRLTKKSEAYDEISHQFLGAFENENAFESLLALCTFAQSKVNGQVFLPIRVHMMFRGLPGLYGCINPKCSENIDSDGKQLFGKLFTFPALKCKCGGRVFEILTHRDCGASYIRGFVSEKSVDFLLHEQAQSLSDNKLTETHFLIESERSHSPKWNYQWVHIKTGKLAKSDPNSVEYIPVRVANNDRIVVEGNKKVWTFSECPVCTRNLIKNGSSKIQDLSTKGEAPFSYLVRAQVEEQPPTKNKDKRYPLRGRKTLVFSDGRQKAARLARDIPRNVEKDIFRICLLLAINFIENNHKNSLKRDVIYVAFLKILQEKNILLFDGDDREKIEVALKKLDRYEDSEFTEILDDTWEPPPAFLELLLINLVGRYYSLFALTLAYVEPTKLSLKKFTEEAIKLGLSAIDCRQIAVNWLGTILDSNYAFDQSIPNGIRRSANGGYGDDSHWGVIKGKSLRNIKLEFLDTISKVALEELLLNEFCDIGENKRYFINPTRIMIKLHYNGEWSQCLQCTKLSVEKIRNLCPYCGSEHVQSLDPNNSQYLRARKSFYRDPVVDVLATPDMEIFNLSVEEHTAQLSYRDENQHTSTNEESERRFKDILINQKDYPVDILSCTTTMEVGVDIGSLTAVSMRNVPPERQNYQQRAGRAGRRGSSISTVLTYAQTGSHDSYYFENPDKIISGDPITPVIDIGNTKVITRHVIAAILQSYFHRLKIDIENESNDLLSVLGLTKDFFEGNNDFNYVSLKNWLSNGFIDDGIKKSISSWIPNHSLDVSDIANQLLNVLETKKPPNFNDEEVYEEKFLNFLFTCDLLPTYAFPRHICSFKIESRHDQYKDIETIENPQQGLATALTEYAPGRLVVINKKTYKIGSVTASSSPSEKNRAELLFSNKKQYLQCPSCMYTEVYQAESQNLHGCTHCGHEGIMKLDVIQPEVVYPEGKKAINEFDDDLYTSTSSAQLPFIGDAPHFELSKFRGETLIGAESNQLLVAINKGMESDNDTNGFWVCDKCGKASAEADKPEDSHIRDYFVRNEANNSKCIGGKFQKVNLGYSFNSDVFLMRLPLRQPLIQIGTGIERNGLISASRSLAEALVQTASLQLEIALSEMNCGIRLLKIDNINYLDIFIYDTAAGGAGYANLIKMWVNTIYTDAEKKLKQTCCDSSCYQCLQHFGNKWHHNVIDKYFGLMLWNYINTSEPPSLYDTIKQRDLASALLELLKLQGYLILNDSESGFIVGYENKEIEIIIYPVLLDPELIKGSTYTKHIYISDYEVLKSTPSAFAKVTSI